MQWQVLDQRYAELNQTGYISRSESDGMPVLEEEKAADAVVDICLTAPLSAPLSAPLPVPLPALCPVPRSSGETTVMAVGGACDAEGAEAAVALTLSWLVFGHK